MALDKLTQITSTGINSTTPLNGISVTGIVTGGAATFDSVDVLGVLTYDDVTNIDALGIVTARTGVHVTSGSVGIGTDNPTELLHLSADSAHEILLKRGGGVPSEVKFANEGNTAIISNNTNGIAFKTGATPSEAMRIEASGNVGIGTDNPGSLVHALGSYGTVRVENSNTAQYAASGIELKGPAGDERSTKIIHGNSNAGGTETYFQIEQYNAAGSYVKTLSQYNYQYDYWAFHSGASGTERLRIASSGNVGIGTDNPSAAYKLHVSDVGGTIALHNSTQSNTIRYANNNTTAEWSAGTSRPGLTNAGDYYSITQYGTDGTWRERFTIDSTGLIKTNQNSIEFGSNGLRLVGTNDVATYGWSSKPGIYATSDQEFRMHSASGGEMDLYVDGFGYFEQGVKGAFVDADAYLQTTMSAGATYTWNPGSGIPANVWVSMNVFCSSMDSDQSDHFDIVIGPTAYSNTVWGDTNAANTPPNEHSIVTHMGDAQDVLGGHYGKWDHVIAKSDSNGDLVFKLNGSNGGSGLNVRIQGYWLDKDSTSVGG